MNSCLYECTVMHHRVQPQEHWFLYKIFQFYLDLDEVDLLSDQLRWMSRNKWNLFSFRDSDHLQLGAPVCAGWKPAAHNAGGTPALHMPTKDHILAYLQQNGMNLENGKIFLLTNLRTLGYVFNPVSFYFCFHADGSPACAVAEIGNTYREMKPFFFGRETRSEKTFQREETKYFYVSPFLDLDTKLDFQLQIPDDTLRIRINDSKQGKTVLFSALTGRKVPLTDARLLQYSLRFPLITLKIISAIHWQAFRLYLKGIPYHKKLTNLHLQKGVYDGRDH